MSTTASTGSPPERRPSGFKHFPQDENSKHPDEDRVHIVQVRISLEFGQVFSLRLPSHLSYEISRDCLTLTPSQDMATELSLKKSVSALSTSKLANQSNPKVRLAVCCLSILPWTSS